MTVLTQLMVYPLLLKKSILFIESLVLFCSKPVTIESVAFSFFVNCSFNNTFSF